MHLHRFDNPQAFYDRVEPFLMAHEAENNLPLGLVSALTKDPNRYGDDPPYMALVEEGGQVAHMALRTPPFNLIMPMTENLDAVKRVAQDVYEKYGTALPGVNAPSEIAKAFAGHWQAITGQAYRKGLSMRMFRLDAVNPPTGVSGQLRPAQKSDRELLLTWIKGFHKDALGEEIDAEQAERAFAHHLDPDDPSKLFVWEDGDPVSFVGCGRPTQNGISIGPVYTPPEKRRSGYASACVAALSQRLLDSGRQFCFLYTNLANPTSNHIYQEIGYRPVCDADEYLFS